VWRDYGEAERKLFLSLMEQCQICFKVTEDVFIAPALLPGRAAMDSAMQQVWRGAAPDAVVRLDYAFLHEGVLRAMLCGIGEKAGVHAVYWAYGICFYDAEHKSTVRIGSDLPDITAGQAGGSVTVEAVGPGAAPLAMHLVESIQRLNIGRPPQVIWEVGEARHDAWADAETPAASEQAFAAVNPAHPPRLPGEAQPVYVSYKWDDESYALVDEIERRLPENFKLIRDKTDMRPGDWISRFMADIGRADLVLVVLSDKYLRSVYCMRELLHLFNTSLGDRDRLMQRMVPLVVGELKCSRARDRDPYVTYWEEEHATVDALLKKRGWASVGEADRGEWLAIQDFQHRISDMLAWVADTLMPQGAEGVDATIDLLQQRALTLGSSGHHRSNPLAER
jgi:internalin A